MNDSNDVRLLDYWKFKGKVDAGINPADHIDTFWEVHFGDECPYRQKKVSMDLPNKSKLSDAFFPRDRLQKQKDYANHLTLNGRKSTGYDLSSTNNASSHVKKKPKEQQSYVNLMMHKSRRYITPVPAIGKSSRPGSASFKLSRSANGSKRSGSKGSLPKVSSRDNCEDTLPLPTVSHHSADSDRVEENLSKEQARQELESMLEKYQEHDLQLRLNVNAQTAPLPPEQQVAPIALAPGTDADRPPDGTYPVTERDFTTMHKSALHSNPIMSDILKGRRSSSPDKPTKAQVTARGGEKRTPLRPRSGIGTRPKSSGNVKVKPNTRPKSAGIARGRPTQRQTGGGLEQKKFNSYGSEDFNENDLSHITVINSSYLDGGTSTDGAIAVKQLQNVIEKAICQSLGDYGNDGPTEVISPCNCNEDSQVEGPHPTNVNTHSKGVDIERSDRNVRDIMQLPDGLRLGGDGAFSYVLDEGIEGQDKDPLIASMPPVQTHPDYPDHPLRYVQVNGDNVNSNPNSHPVYSENLENSYVDDTNSFGCDVTNANGNNLSDRDQREQNIAPRLTSKLPSRFFDNMAYKIAHWDNGLIPPKNPTSHPLLDSPNPAEAQANDIISCEDQTDTADGSTVAAGGFIPTEEQIEQNKKRIAYSCFRGKKREEIETAADVAILQELAGFANVVMKRMSVDVGAGSVNSSAVANLPDLSVHTPLSNVAEDVDPTPHRAVSLMHVASPHAARKHSGRSKRQAKVSPFDSPKVTGTSAGTSFGPRNTKFFNSSPKKDPFLGPRSPDPANTPVNNAPIRSSLSPNSRNKPEDLQCVPECDSTVGDVIDAIPQTSESSAIQAALHRVAAVESVVSPTPAASVPAPASDSQDKAAPKLALTSLFSKKTSARSLSFMTGSNLIALAAKKFQAKNSVNFFKTQLERKELTLHWEGFLQSMTKAGVNTSLETDYVTMKAEDKDGDNVKSPTNSNVSSEKRFGFGKLRSRSKQAITLLESIDASSVILAATKNTKVYKGVKCVEVASIIGGNVDGESDIKDEPTVDCSSSPIVALKIAQYDALDPDDPAVIMRAPLAIMQEYKKELLNLTQLGPCRHLVKCFGVVLHPLTIVLEYCPNGSLFDNLGSDAWQIATGVMDRVRILDGVASGMDYMHSRRFLHRDIKPENILLFSDPYSSDVVAKICDFGAAVMVHASGENGEGSVADLAGSAGYMAPEIYTPGKYSYPADVFSFAVVMWQTFAHAGRENPMKVSAKADIIHNIETAVRPKIGPEHPALIAELSDTCWNRDAAQRLPSSALKGIFGRLLSSPSNFRHVYSRKLISGMQQRRMSQMMVYDPAKVSSLVAFHTLAAAKTTVCTSVHENAEESADSDSDADDDETLERGSYFLDNDQDVWHEGYFDDVVVPGYIITSDKVITNNVAATLEDFNSSSNRGVLKREGSKLSPQMPGDEAKDGSVAATKSKFNFFPSGPKCSHHRIKPMNS